MVAAVGKGGGEGLGYEEVKNTISTAMVRLSVDVVLLFLVWAISGVCSLVCFLNGFGCGSGALALGLIFEWSFCGLSLVFC